MHRLHLPPSQRGDGPLAAGGVSKVGTSKIKEFQVEGRTKAKCFFRGILLFLLFLLFAAPANASPRIDSVKATVTSSEAIPSPVTARMETSIEAIASQLLLGKPADMPAADAAKQAVLIREVFDKVLVGYTVTDAEVVPGETARVQVTLVPWADRVQSVAVETQVDGMTPEVESMVRQDLAGVEHVFDRALLGLPIAAADWTNGVLKREVNAYLAEHLPEFRADFDVTADTNAQVKLTVYPRVPVVRTVDLSMRSDTMPNVLLLTHRELLKDRVNVLVGVPVAFTERHRAAFEQLFADAIDVRPDFRALRMKTHVTITTGERAAVMARSDSDRYRVRATGWVDIGRQEGATHSNEDDLVGQLHAGVRYSELSGGDFDITVGGVTELWDFHADPEDAKLPDADALAEAVKHVGYDKIEFDGNKVRLTDPETKIDLGGIAKGYIGDRMADLLEERGVTSGIVNLGGNVICIGGKTADDDFVIGVEAPFSDRTEIVGKIGARDMTLVTSGVYERKIEVDGKLYHHILSTKTGYSADTDLDAVTLTAEKGHSMDTDALSTICLIKGYEEASKLIEKTDGVEAVFVLHDGSIQKTSGAKFEKE